MTKGISIRALCLGTAASIAFISGPQVAHAQRASDDTDHSKLEEIVVTARSGAEKLIQVPVAVTALSATQLARYNSTDLREIGQTTPSLNVYTGGSGSGATMQIRGVGTTADNIGADPSVSLAIDGTQVGRTRVVLNGLFDLQQVEIMKGPQALFFGKNSSAGVVSLKSANPTDQISGYVKGGYEINAKERYGEAAFGGPITDQLKIRVAGRYSKLDGWVRNLSYGLTKPDPGNPSVQIPGASDKWGPGTETYGGRVTLVWTPSSNYTSIMKATFTHLQDHSSNAYETICSPGVTPTTLGFSDPLSDCKLDGRTSTSETAPIYTSVTRGNPIWKNGKAINLSKTALATWQQSLDLGKVDVTANTGFSHINFTERGNKNGQFLTGFTGGTDEKSSSFGQEIRAVSKFDGPFNVTVGGYYEHTHVNHDDALLLPEVGPNPTPGPDFGSYQSAYNTGKERDTTWSFFGQARYQILPNLELAGGARWTQTKKDVVEGQPDYVHAFLTGVFANYNFYANIKEHNVSPEATLTWHPSPDQTLYAAFKTGYKSGGISQPALITVPTVLPGQTLAQANAAVEESLKFKPEKARGGEIGYKASLLDHRLQVELTAYFYKFIGLQLTSFDTNTSSYRFYNAADATQKGIEGSINYKATPELTLRGAFDLNSLKYGKFPNAACYSLQTVAEGCVNGVQDLSHRQLQRAPKFVGTVGFGYDRHLSDDLMIGLDSDFQYTTPEYLIETFEPLSRQSAYLNVNATLRIYKSDKKWELALIGRDLTNKRLIEFISDKPGGGAHQMWAGSARPRQVSLEGTVRF